tara:strand:- start:7 stop:375 length:369 start_codon:yes stop_codon:yes gene_type:complete
MKIFDEVNDSNFMLFAARHYYNPKCIDVDEFYEDLNRFKYVKRLLNRYIESGDLPERLILNHLIVIFNAFDVVPALKMLEHKLDERHWPIVKPFLLFLRHIKSSDYLDVKMDWKVVEALRKI